MDDNGRATIREVYAIAERIESKVDHLAEKVEGRLDTLERWRAWATGVGAAVSFGLGIAMAVLR